MICCHSMKCLRSILNIFHPLLYFCFYCIMLHMWDVCFCLLLGYPDKLRRIWSWDRLWYFDNWWWGWSWRPQNSAPSVSSQCFPLDFACQVFLKNVLYYSFSLCLTTTNKTLHLICYHQLTYKYIKSKHNILECVFKQEPIWK